MGVFSLRSGKRQHAASKAPITLDDFAELDIFRMKALIMQNLAEVAAAAQIIMLPELNNVGRQVGKISIRDLYGLFKITFHLVRFV